MFRRRKGSFLLLSGEINLLILSYLLLSTRECGCFEREAILLKATPATVNYLHIPYRSLFDRVPLNYRYRYRPFKQKLPRGPIVEEYLRIEPSDAISDLKYSQPAINYHAENSNPEPVPSKSAFEKGHQPNLHRNSSHSVLENHIPSPKVHQNTSLSKNVRFLESASSTHFSEDILESLNGNHSVKVNDSHVENLQEFPSDVTESQAHLIPSSSDNILNYENPSISFDDADEYKHRVPSKKSSERAIGDVPSHFSNISKFIYSDTNASTLSPDLVTPPFVLHAHVFDEIVNHTNSVNNNETTIVPSTYDVENISSGSISFPSENRKLSTGTVAGIVIGVLVCTTILSSAVIYLLYQKYNGRCTSVVEGKFNSDNCGYLDDSLRSSIYLNNHIELPKESSEEMSSLDNDSFLNSLETMTIQNYWTDSSKNTKV